MSQYEAVPRGTPPLRRWNLTSDSTRYDYLLAAESDQDLSQAWSLWASLALFVATFVGLLFLSILCNNKTRKNAFNLYLVYLMVPDLVFSGGCGVTCLMNSIRGRYWSEKMCYAQSFYLVFGITANIWINALIANEIHALLKSSQIRRRYTAPTVTQVSLHSLLCYVWSLFLACLIFIDGIPHRNYAIQGLACLPVEFSRASTIFYFCVYILLAVGIPVVYVLFVIYDVLRRKLLPPKGKRRQLSNYFFRLFAVFAVMWTPFFLVVLVAGSWMSHGVLVAFGSWSHMQGFVSAVVSLSKPDIREAFLKFLCCGVMDLSYLEAGSNQMWATRSACRVYLSSRKNGSSNNKATTTDAGDFLPEQDSTNFQFADELRSSLRLSVSNIFRRSCKKIELEAIQSELELIAANAEEEEEIENIISADEGEQEGMNGQPCVIET